LMSLSAQILAQADTAQARQVYADINKTLAAMGRVNATAQRADVSYRSELMAWADSTGVRKIRATDHDDDGDVISDYYYTRGALIFVYQAIKGFDETGKQATRSEERQYFQNGKMFKWLSGLDKAANASSDAGFADQAKTRLAAAKLFFDVATKAGKQVPPQHAGQAAKQTIGTITGLQSGDVACYVSLKDDQGVAFEELAEFEICENTKLLKQRVRLSYVNGTVMADSCQGDVACRARKAVMLIHQATILAK
jgi:hypothetical protein